MLWEERLKAELVLAMDTDTDSAVRLFLSRAAADYDVAYALLFGSRARNDFAPDSDADVAVILHGNAGDFVATKLAMTDLAYDVLLETGIRIQPLPIWTDEWSHPDRYANPRLLENIAREGRRL